MKYLFVVVSVFLLVACGDVDGNQPRPTTTPTLPAAPSAGKTTVPTSSLTSTVPASTPAGDYCSGMKPGAFAQWGWCRAQLAAAGQHDFLRGEIRRCQQLIRVAQMCFFEKNEESDLEFAYDGVSTYFVAYRIGDRTNILEDARVGRIQRTILGELLLPLRVVGCPNDPKLIGVEVTVVYLDTSGLRSWCEVIG